MKKRQVTERGQTTHDGKREKERKRNLQRTDMGGNHTGESPKAEGRDTEAKSLGDTQGGVPCHSPNYDQWQ